MATTQSTPDKTAYRLKTVHGWATLIWVALAVPTVLVWKESILWIGLMSVYSCIMGHFSSWQASRAEVAEHDKAPAH